MKKNLDSTKKEFTDLRTFNELSMIEKIEYFWDYYKIHTIVGIITLILVISGVKFIFSDHPTDALNISVFNQSLDAEKTDLMVRSLSDYLTLDPKYEKVTFDTSLYLDLENAGDQNNSSTLMKITATVAASALDIMISKEDIASYFTKIDYCLDLETLLAEDLYAKVEDRIYVAKDSVGNELPYGIYIDGTDFAADLGLQGEKIVLYVILNSTNQDNVVELIRYIFGDGK